MSPQPAAPDPLDGHAASLLAAAQRVTTPEAHAAVRAGFDVLERFLAALNRRDARAWARTLNYPHVRIAGGQLQLWADAEAYVRDNDIEAFLGTGWAGTRWERILPVQAGSDKVHFALRLTRHDSLGQPLASYDALYVVTRDQGHWGVQLRSSYAGTPLRLAAF